VQSGPIKVKMFGDFSISWGNAVISNSSNRMHKVWLLLAYLIYRRGHVISQDEMISLLWENSVDQCSVQGSLKTTLYRARAMLDNLCEGAGHLLIQRRGSSYTWNTDIPLEFDAEKFDSLYVNASKSKDEDKKLALQREALELYEGEFLYKLSMENWVVPIAAYYHKLFLQMTEDALSVLETRGLWEDAAPICRMALKIEPYSEALYCHSMKSLLARGDEAAAIAAYEEMSELLFSTFGVMPSDEATALYRQARGAVKDAALTAVAVRDHLKETDLSKGAFFCEYDYFKTLYRMTARSIARSGDTVHLAVLTIKSKDKEPLSRRSLDKAAENLKSIVVSSLRQGDVVSQCSLSQFVLLLPQANYENSCVVCARIIRGFFRKYPHSPADISFNVQPLEPRMPEA